MTRPDCLNSCLNLAVNLVYCFRAALKKNQQKSIPFFYHWSWKCICVKMDLSLEITAINYLLSIHWGRALKKKKSHCSSFPQSHLFLLSLLVVCVLHWFCQHYSLDPNDATGDHGEESDVSELTQGKEALSVMDWCCSFFGAGFCHFRSL